MKIGILTFHKALNYGAFMQCFSLSKKIKERFPSAEVEVIDYASYNMVHDYEKNAFERIFGAKNDPIRPGFILILKRMAKFLLGLSKMRTQKNAKMQRSLNFKKVYSYLPLSKESLVSDNPDEFKNFVDGKYDILVVGSDAIWNDNQTNIPNMYLLNNIFKSKKLSYAASTYGMDYLKKSDKEITYNKEALEKFDFIGVRDNVSEKYVKYCAGDEIKTYHTCDPSVFLSLEDLPVNLNDIKEKLIKHGVDFNKPVIGLMCSDWLAKLVREAVGDKAQLVSVYCRNGYEDIFLDDLTPFQWARVFSLFDATVTHFFHGTLFSIKNGTLTFSVEKATDYNKVHETKIQDVLKRLDLYEDCYYLEGSKKSMPWEKMLKTVLNNDKEMTKLKYKERLDNESKSSECFFDKLGAIINNE